MKIKTDYNSEPFEYMTKSERDYNKPEPDEDDFDEDEDQDLDDSEERLEENGQDGEGEDI